MTDPLARLATALGDRYRIERELGAGGMATVYLSQDLKHDRPVAIKVLRPDLAAALGPERFLREVKIAANLQHPHILPLNDSGEADGFLYYVMPFVDGISLREKLVRDGELPIPDAVRILRDLADAMAYAHRRGVVHRDLKPENIMLSGRHALVTDFGVAKAVSEATGADSLTTAGMALGTPAYMAPEQAAADPHVDHRADLYAFGVVAYELLTGQPPFTAATPQALLSAQGVGETQAHRTHRSSFRGRRSGIQATTMSWSWRWRLTIQTARRWSCHGLSRCSRRLRLLERLVRPRLADERVGLRAVDRVDGKVDIQIRPVQMMWAWPLEQGQLADCGVREPWKLFESDEPFPVINQQPEAVGRHVRHLSPRNGRPKPSGFHPGSPELCVSRPQGASASIVIVGEADLRPDPELRLTGCVLHMNMRPGLFARKEVEPVPARPEGWTHGPKDSGAEPGLPRGLLAEPRSRYSRLPGGILESRTVVSPTPEPP